MHPRPSFDLLAGAAILSPTEMAENAWMVIRHGRIASIRSASRWRKTGPVVDVRPWIVTPGFVNAHTHLELTGLSLPHPKPARLDDWIAGLVQSRSSWPVMRARRAAVEGIRRCLATGTTTVGEIESLGASRVALRAGSMRAVVYREFLGLAPERAASIWREAERSLESSRSATLRWGLSPHAPYSLSPDLLRFAGVRLRRHRTPMAIHCAESPAERELLARGEGPLWRMLRRLGKWPHGAPVPGAGPLDVLDRAGLLRPQTLLVHGNDLRPRELDRVRERGCVMVFCPGSHRFFRYPKYPLREILRRRIPLGLGTDSLASNEDLSMPREMAIVRESFPQIAPEIIFEMATLGGARALGWERRIGSLHPGKEADLAVIGVRVGRKRRPILEEITSARPDTLFAYIGGQQAFPPSRRVL